MEKREDGEFGSNQPVSILLGICADSRSFYFQQSKAIYAFNTYINFESDTIYLRESDDCNLRKLDFALLEFLKSLDIGKIERLAVSEGVTETGPTEVLEAIGGYMPECRGIEIVIDDQRVVFTALLDREVRLRSARLRPLSTRFVGRIGDIRSCFWEIEGFFAGGI